MSSAILVGVSAFLSVVSSALYAAAISASSTTDDVVKSTAWATASDSGIHLYLGFKGLLLTYSGGSTFSKFPSDCDGDKACKACSEPGGTTATALVAVALAFAILSVVIAIVRVISGNSMMKIVHAAFNALAWIFGIAAFASYTNCLNELNKEISTDFSAGPGFGCCVAAAALMIISMVLAFVAPDDGAAEHKPAAIPTSSVIPPN